MPTPELDHKAIKVTINLFVDDVETIKKHTPRGVGWSTYVRDIIHEHCKTIKRAIKTENGDER